MKHLYQQVQDRVAQWRDGGYPCEDYPAVAEILDYATIPADEGPAQLRFLRAAQLQALETYWYLRLIEDTPHIFELYRRCYPKPMDLLAALGMDTPEMREFLLNELMEGGSPDALWEKVREGDKFVKRHKLESVHETLTLDYPSYIFALAMGAGKTILIGAIVATEFAMALEYHPRGDGPFVQNALVFAPGLTIFESLRELAEVPFKEILPPRLYRAFDATYKITFTQEGQKDLPIIRGSRYNLVVSNTEKIRIQKRTYRHHTWSDLYAKMMQEQYAEEANLRLQAIASLPNLGVFSDEAHHTYGQDITKDLKRVRQTVDYLHENTSVVCVVNTTGTPYYQRQPLRDVVIWYGLSQGIEDNILKSLDDSIFAYDYPESRQFVAEVVGDFFDTYGDVTLPNGAPAKLAIYFPQNDDLENLRPVVEQTLVANGYPIDIVLRNTERSSTAEVDAFNRLNDPDSRHRVILLVNKGTEGWNCPSLFACALARTLKSSQNFVLQASTRCLRQVPGNEHNARIYLSMENRGILDRQLQETYGETIEHLRQTKQDRLEKTLVLRKTDIPPLVIKRLVRRVVPISDGPRPPLEINQPDAPAEMVARRHTFTPGERPDRVSVLEETSAEEITYEPVGYDAYTAATRLAANYRVDVMDIYRQLKHLYTEDGMATVPESHMPHLARQIEEQTRGYAIREEEVEVALALVRPRGFKQQIRDGEPVYVTEITYPVDKEHLLLSLKSMVDNNRDPGRFGFHYDPYYFDSQPEQDFFMRMLDRIKLHPDDIEDIYFTGGLTDPGKTDFYIEYLDLDNRRRFYSPDFVIRCKNGRCYIIEIKAENQRHHPIDGQDGRKAMAMRRLEDVNPDRLSYEIIFTDSDEIPTNHLQRLRQRLSDCRRPISDPSK